MLFGSFLLIYRNPGFSECPVTPPQGDSCCCERALAIDGTASVPGETFPFFYEEAMDCMAPDHVCANHCNFADPSDVLLDKSCIFYVQNSSQCDRVEGCEALPFPSCHFQRSEVNRLTTAWRLLTLRFIFLHLSEMHYFELAPHNIYILHACIDTHVQDTHLVARVEWMREKVSVGKYIMLPCRCVQ